MTSAGSRWPAPSPKLLMDSGVSLGILGNRENSDGNDAMVMGESGLFQYLAEANIQIFREHAVKKIISLDPHAYNAFSNHYEELGGVFQVRHYSEVLGELISFGKLSPAPQRIKVTYHDPLLSGPPQPDLRTAAQGAGRGARPGAGGDGTLAQKRLLLRRRRREFLHRSHRGRRPPLPAGCASGRPWPRAPRWWPWPVPCAPRCWKTR